jgi:hypothetical protein
MVLGLRGLRALQDKFSTKGVRPHLLAGIATGLLGTLLISGVCYLTAIEFFWPAVGRRVDRVFRDIDKERFNERYDSFWPAFREIAPDALYRAADERWPPMNYYVPESINIDEDDDRWPRKTYDSIKMVVFRGWIRPGSSGNLIRRHTLQNAAEPVIALGKPAVPYLFKWVSHHDWHVRFVAIYALEQITQQKTRAPYFEPIDLDAQHFEPIDLDAQREAIQNFEPIDLDAQREAIQIWQKWYGEQP